MAASVSRSVRARLRHARRLVRLTPLDTRTVQGRSNERYRRIALTVFSSLGLRGVGTVIGLVTVPLVLEELGKARFGLWATITTVVAWFSLSDLGIASGLLNCLSRAHGRDDHEEARRYVATALVALVGIAAALAVAIGVAGPLIPWTKLLAVRGAVDDTTAKWSVMAALGTFALGVPLSIAPQIFAGYQKTYLNNLFALVGMLIGLGLIVAAVRTHVGLAALVMAFSAGGLIGSALGLTHVLRTMPWLRVRWSAVSVSAARGLLRRSIPLFLYQIGALLVNEAQALILAHRCDLRVVADYAVLMRLYLLVAGLVQMSTASFIPSFREAGERGDRAWVASAFRTFAGARVLLAVGGAVGFVLFGNVLLRLWLGRTTVAFGVEVWMALGVQLVAATWVTAHADLLSIMDRLWVLVALVLFNGAVTVMLSYGMAPRFQVLGVILAGSAATVTLFSWVLPILTRSLRLGAVDPRVGTT